jgi:hypothetical protein
VSDGAFRITCRTSHFAFEGSQPEALAMTTETAYAKWAELTERTWSYDQLSAFEAGIAHEKAASSADEQTRAMFVARLENMEKNGDRWLTVNAVLALLNDCDMLATREVKP